MKWCRICGGQVIGADNWIELPSLGRFWLCDVHFNNCFFLPTEHVGYAYRNETTREFLILGPYPYEHAPDTA